MNSEPSPYTLNLNGIPRKIGNEVKKMEIPTLPEEEKWEMMREIFVLNKQADIGFIMQMGTEKMSEYSEMTSQQYADMLQAQGKDDAIGFAMSEATVRKNLMGSDVEKVNHERR